MAQLVGADEIEALHTELSDIGRSLRTPFRLHNSSSVKDAFDEDLIQQWAKIERLPTYERSRAFLFDEHNDENEDVKGKRVTDVRELGALDRHLFVERLIRQIEADNLHLLQKLRNRIDKAGIKLPAIEVKYQNLCVEAKCSVVDGKPLPTLWNSLKGKLSVFTKVVGSKLQEARISIVQNVSGIIKPGRLTLLLGPPGCGKTSLLLALSGNMKKSLKVSGEITYNGYKLNELVPQKNSVYVSQYDVHIPEITVRETADFSARCQGVGSRAEIMIELCRREKQAGIIPEPDIDAYMKAISTEGLKNTLQTDYILKILGLDVCSDTIVGDAMRRGISGGQKKRLTTGEMIVGPTKALLLDEITNGLDSSTAYQIVAYIQQLVHITDTTALVALLQPAPEIFHLFDDVIMMAEGKIIYHGPRSSVLGFFEECGFRCPHRKGVADFLQEVISRKDQQQYWFLDDQPYSYFSVDMFCEKFTASNVGRRLYGEVSQQYFKSESDEKAISFNVYSLSKWELLKACMSREYLLIKRNSFVYLFKIIQLVIVAFMSMTLFLRTRLGVINVNYYMGALFYALNILLVDGFPEAGLTVIRLPVFFKQRDMYFYPAWACTIPSSILRIPLSVLASFVWTSITYYVIGYSPEFGRFFRQFLLLSAVHFTSLSFFRFFAALFQTMVAVMSAGSSFLLFVFIFSGFVIPQSSMPAWLKWGFLVSPLSYGEIGVSVNEFLAPRWKKMTLSNATIGSIGRQALDLHGLDFADYYYWISYWALVGFAILANIGYTLALTFLKAPGTPAAIISREKLAQLQGVFHPRSGAQVSEKITSHVETKLVPGKGRMVLPFQPLTIAFRNMNYYVDTPMKQPY